MTKEELEALLKVDGKQLIWTQFVDRCCGTIWWPGSSFVLDVRSSLHSTEAAAVADLMKKLYQVEVP